MPTTSMLRIVRFGVSAQLTQAPRHEMAVYSNLVAELRLARTHSEVFAKFRNIARG